MTDSLHRNSRIDPLIANDLSSCQCFIGFVEKIIMTTDLSEDNDGDGDTSSICLLLTRLRGGLITGAAPASCDIEKGFKFHSTLLWIPQ